MENDKLKEESVNIFKTIIEKSYYLKRFKFDIIFFFENLSLFSMKISLLKNKYDIQLTFVII